MFWKYIPIKKVCVNLPIIRKVVKVGAAKGITLPKSWLEFAEVENGQEVKQVAVEVNRVLKIEPYFGKGQPKKREENQL